MTVPEAIAQTAQLFPHRKAVIFGDREHTYLDLDASVTRVAKGLVSIGIKPGDRVAIMALNSDAYVFAYAGIMRAGASVVPVNPVLKPDEVAYMLRDSEAKAVIALEALKPVVEAAAARLAHAPFVVTVGGGGEPGSLESWLSADATDGALPPVSAQDVAAILYTSGTTGRPKGAMLTHGNLVANATACRQAIRFTEDDIIMTVLPMFHSYAATVGVVLPLLTGACIVVVERFAPLEVPGVFQRRKCTVLPCVPAMCVALLRARPHIPDDALDSLRLCVSGGAPFPVELMQRFEQAFGVTVIEGDGPTECGPVTSVNPVEGERKPGSIGLPIPTVEMKIVNDDDEELPDGEIGEICVRGPSVMAGYLNQPEATAEAMRGGWFHTGDLGYRDEDGYYYIVDRKKDMLIVGGLNVYPREVEEVLHTHPAVLEAAVIGVPDEIRGERVRAVVVLREGAQAQGPDLIRHCRERLANFKVPKDVVFVDELPKTLTGKVLKRELRDSHSG